MAAVNDLRVNEGDWVSGTTMEDERFIGFVESTEGNGLIKIRITQCDRPETVGDSAEAKLSKVNKLPVFEPTSETPLRSLIEIALMAKDREWFEELSNKLAASTADQADKRMKKNRLETDFLLQPPSRLN
ncbi:MULTISPECIES: hypothetical protein [unclassified Paenibacillus]|uniref:hypothetical protein n=1 Tax=unclassified Paenibacillus TaxID=185978 RepID=UPI001AE7554C|nr:MULTISPECIES: hypothetical protein [unclassified Paenibacillus]MBP1153883.1 hypothetical protein [Paenibacillus sp. PvP091]MBP1170732.1 hypothetical protein [Paenibacillus sp. PvR098]MBP2441760.1 hypothetical protein [Paenibacillus sp. PvP052]